MSLSYTKELTMAIKGRYGRSSKGFTLVEVVVTLSVVAILSAILIPLISNNIRSAKFARARSDVDAIKDAIIKFRYDLGKWPVYNSANTFNNLLYGEGNRITSSSWETSAGTKLSLRYNLIDNTNNYQKGPSKDGTPAWNGPYIGKVKQDPWNNAYYVNSVALNINNRRVWVLSAGQDKAIAAPLNGSSDPPANSDDIYEYLK